MIHDNTLKYFGEYALANPDGAENFETTAGRWQISETGGYNDEFWLKAEQRDTASGFIQLSGWETWKNDFGASEYRPGSYSAGTFIIGMSMANYGSAFNGRIHLNECYLYQRNPNSPQRVGKYVLRPAPTSQANS